MKTTNYTTASARDVSLNPGLRRAFLIILLPFVLLVLPPATLGVSPAPDGGYGGQNTAEGTDALFSRTTGIWNSAFGFQALHNDTTGSRNTAVGFEALFNTNSAYNTGENVAVGTRALFNNTTGTGNIAIGTYALRDNTTGSNNIAIGNRALMTFNGGSGVTVVGDSFESGPDYVSVGRPATVDSHCGVLAGVLTASIHAYNDIYVGDPYMFCYNPGTNRVHITANDAVYVIPVYNNPIAGSSVTVNSDGQLGVAPSSARFKDEIKPMDEASEAIFALKPVRFHYKQKIDSKKTPQFGLVAEDVEKIDPNLITRDPEGKPYSVRYDAVNAMLLNEFLKEHRKIEEFQTTAAQQAKEITALKEALKEQAAQIQKVSSQLEMSRPAPQVVVIK
jgi:hypothetical protein